MRHLMYLAQVESSWLEEFIKWLLDLFMHLAGL